MSNKLFVLYDIPPPSNPSGGRRLLWTVALQVPLSMEFPKQEHWNGLPCPPPKDLPDPGIEPRSLMTPALAGWFFTTSATKKSVTDRKRYLLEIHRKQVVKCNFVAFIVENFRFHQKKTQLCENL